MSTESQRFAFPVQALDVAREWSVGPVTLKPAGQLVRELTARVDPNSAESSLLRQIRQDVLDEAKGMSEFATAEVDAADQESAATAISASLDVLRLFQRWLHPMVSLDRHTFGLVGELEQSERRALVLDDEPGWTWHRLGNLATWTFDAADIAKACRDARFLFLCRSLSNRDNPEGGELGRRALLCLQILTKATLSYDPRIGILFTAMAVEVLLSDHGQRGAVLRIARRHAFINCEAQCGRQRPACDYVQGFASRKQMIESIRAANAAGQHGLCTAFLDISEELFRDRNDIVHEGRADFAEGRGSHHRWVVDRLLMGVLEWFTSHDGAAFEALDAEIREAASQGPSG